MDLWKGRRRWRGCSDSWRRDWAIEWWSGWLADSRRSRSGRGSGLVRPPDGGIGRRRGRASAGAVNRGFRQSSWTSDSSKCPDELAHRRLAPCHGANSTRNGHRGPKQVPDATGVTGSVGARGAVQGEAGGRWRWSMETVTGPTSGSWAAPASRRGFRCARWSGRRQSAAAPPAVAVPGRYRAAGPGGCTALARRARDPCGGGRPG